MKVTIRSYESGLKGLEFGVRFRFKVKVRVRIYGKG